MRSRGKGRGETVPGFEVPKNPGFVLFLPFGPLLIVRVRSSSSSYIATCGMQTQYYSNVVRRIASWSVRHFPGHFPMKPRKTKVGGSSTDVFFAAPKSAIVLARSPPAELCLSGPPRSQIRQKLLRPLPRSCHSVLHTPKCAVNGRTILYSKKITRGQTGKDKGRRLFDLHWPLLHCYGRNYVGLKEG